jgi:hypothetical protein
MSMRGKFFGLALGASLLFAGAAYAGAPEPRQWRAERQERIARDEIRRGEMMEREGRRLESQGQWRRGERLERRGESLERHGHQMLAAAERHEHYPEYR